MTPPTRSRRRHMLYENTYVWLVFVSALDIMLTWVVLWHQGREVNPLADFILRSFGLVGMVAFKFALIVFVILLCEAVGKRNARAGRRFATAAVLIGCLPVMIAFVQLLARV